MINIPFLHVKLFEPDVAITDWILAAECLIFVIFFLRTFSPSKKQKEHVILFLALMIASLLGGVYHGFFPLKTETAAGWLVWIGTMLSLGLTSSALFLLSMNVILPAHMKNALYLGVGAFIGYAYWIIYKSHDFRIAVFFYLPMLMLFLGSLFIKLIRHKDHTVIAGIYAVLLMLIAAGIQQLKIGLHPQYFNHNALYHFVQGIALYLLFLTLKNQYSNSKKFNFLP